MVMSNAYVIGFCGLIWTYLRIGDEAVLEGVSQDSRSLSKHSVLANNKAVKVHHIQGVNEGSIIHISTLQEQ